MIKYYLGDKGDILASRLASYESQNLAKRLFDKDPSLWIEGPAERHQMIVDRLGWLNLPEWSLSKVKEIMQFVAAVRKDKFTDIVLLGMGGSSLAPEVMSITLGVKQYYPNFYMLDATDPEAVANIEKQIKLSSTLFIMSSKSGGTVETNSQFKYFYDQLSKIKKTGIGAHFVAITDDGTSLQRLAQEKGFRKIFVNPSDIGGRFSVLSFFGMVPAALMGVDLKKFLRSAIKMRKAIIETEDLKENPAIYPGLVLAELAKDGIDKMTLLIPGKFYPLGYWIEQLVAESTGKEEKGIIPVEGEPVAALRNYSSDRVFVAIGLKSQFRKLFSKKVNELKKAGMPVIVIKVSNVYDLAGEFYRWEIATAAMGVVFGIDPFDQPNVQSAKTLTNKLLANFQEKGKFPTEDPVVTSKGMSVYTNSKIWDAGKSLKTAKSLEDVLKAYLGTVTPGDYLSFLSFMAKSEAVQGLFDEWRKMITYKLRITTLHGYGPRYLHSIGQLHKGGPNRGLFIEFVVQNDKDLQVPGEVYTFGQLKYAQAVGDYQALQEANCRTLRIELGKNYMKDLETFGKALENVLEQIK